MMKLTVDKEKINSTIEKIVFRTMQMDEPWEWPMGVAYYGVALAYELTGNQSWLKLLRDRYDELIALGLPDWVVNTCAMGHGLITLYDATKDEKYNHTLYEALAYLRERAPRFGEGTLQHTVSAKDDFPEQAWADTLFMAAFLMLRVGVRDHDKALINDALHQYVTHIDFLQNQSDALWYHGYANQEKGGERSHMSGFYWARANAWAAYTMSQVGKILPEPYLYPPYMEISCSLRDQLASIKTLQTENGLWHTVLDDTESYEELSASCGIAAAMVVNGNPLHSKYVQKALSGICGHISEDGRLLNVSGGTAVMRDLAGYREVPKTRIQGWGQGLALAFLVSVVKYSLSEVEA
ncbi:MAG: glycoside hydrolase family 88 protein [Clostridium sp.]|jgi:unsaturated rhamnogalacturonyl hydrolase|nr:glycoside hydrolase family 88 protein [Clostridium sp.]